jgi:hypothetical protein
MDTVNKIAALREAKDMSRTDFGRAAASLSGRSSAAVSVMKYCLPWNGYASRREIILSGTIPKGYMSIKP